MNIGSQGGTGRPRSLRHGSGTGRDGDLTGWTSTGIISGQNPSARFHDHHDAIRGKITRSDLHAEDPAGATFAISVQVAGLRYAEALRALAALRRAAIAPDRPIGPHAELMDDQAALVGVPPPVPRGPGHTP
jgi:hypothetical protein